LANVMRKSTLTKKIPLNWRDANIVPIYKMLNIEASRELYIDMHSVHSVQVNGPKGED